MFYYKSLDGFFATNKQIINENFIEITKKDFDKVIEETNATEAAENIAAEQEERLKDEQIAALEEENAALLYKLLTGDDLE